MNEKARPVFYSELEWVTSETEGGYEHYECRHNIVLVTKNIHNNHQGLVAELAIDAPDYNIKKDGADILHLQDNRARNSLAISLAECGTEPLPWRDMLDYVAAETILRYRQGEPSEQIWTNQDVIPPSFIVDPLIQEGVPNIWYGDQEGLKTTAAMFICGALVQLGEDYQNKVGIKVNGKRETYWLDWEIDRNLALYKLKQIKNGLNVGDLGLHYKRCEHPLNLEMDGIRNYIDHNDIGLVVIDSLGMAAGGDLSDPKQALSFHAALRTLKVTSVILAHPSKSLNSTKTVFGSVFFETPARGKWEMQKVDYGNTARVAFHDRKHSYSGTRESLGLAFNFDLDTITVSAFDTETEPELLSKAPTHTRILSELDNDNYSPKALSELLGLNESTCRGTLKRLTDDGKVEKLASGEYRKI